MKIQKVVSVSFYSDCGNSRYTGTATITPRKVIISKELEALYPPTVQGISESFKAFKKACRDAIKTDSYITMGYGKQITIMIDPM